MAISFGIPSCAMYRKLQPRHCSSLELKISIQILAIGMIFLPESPRHLMAIDREDEAMRILRKLHYDGTNGKLIITSVFGFF